jgi:hypothetical protein
MHAHMYDEKRTEQRCPAIVSEPVDGGEPFKVNQPGVGPALEHQQTQDLRVTVPGLP